jgi:hypothetical protein
VTVLVAPGPDGNATPTLPVAVRNRQQHEPQPVHVGAKCFYFGAGIELVKNVDYSAAWITKDCIHTFKLETFSKIFAPASFIRNTLSIIYSKNRLNIIKTRLYKQAVITLILDRKSLFCSCYRPV